MSPQAVHRRTLGLCWCSNLSKIDEKVRKIAARKIAASALNTFTVTFPDNMRMKFVMTAT